MHQRSLLDFWVDLASREFRDVQQATCHEWLRLPEKGCFWKRRSYLVFVLLCDCPAHSATHMPFELAFVALFSVATAVALAARWLRAPYDVRPRLRHSVTRLGVCVGVAIAVLHLRDCSLGEITGVRSAIRKTDSAHHRATESGLVNAPPTKSSEELDPGDEKPPRTYNVVLITVDTLRFDLGYMGYPKPITPNIDMLAARSTVFERAYATASYTPKSLGPMMIGRYASETARDGEHFTTFYPKNTFVAERVRSAGGHTFAAMCHHYFKWDTGFRQGFRLWDTSAIPPGLKDNDKSVSSDRLSDVALRLFEDRENVTPSWEPDASAPDGPRRFFAWFHYLDPHLQYVPHEDAPGFGGGDGGRARSQRDLYDEEVWFTDKHIGRLLDHIASQSWGRNTAIILTADHGEAFGERGFWRHGRELWEPVVRVPLIVHVPGAPPRRIREKRSHIDVAPTILDLMGALPTEEGELRGKSLTEDAFARSGQSAEERDIYMDMPEGPYNEMRQAIITGDSPGQKLIYFGGTRYELYDLEVDPDETKDLVRDEERFRAALSRFRRLRSQLQEVRSH